MKSNNTSEKSVELADLPEQEKQKLALLVRPEKRFLKDGYGIGRIKKFLATLKIHGACYVYKKPCDKPTAIQQVLEIYNKMKARTKYGEAAKIAAEYGINPATAFNIASGKKWSSVTGQMKPARKTP